MPPVFCVIPARYGAQRFPGKPLADLLGKPVIQWVWEAARTIRGVDEVIVATDDDRIRRAVESFGGTVAMTPPSCPSGSDRIAMALQDRPCSAIVNVQGDEPLIHAETVAGALQALLDDPDCAVATACVPIRDRETFERPSVVKVVRGRDDVALYFSRSPIPSPSRLDPGETAGPGFVWGYKHLGIYVYRPEALRAFVAMSRSPLETVESLEQLRFLEAGYRIRCIETPHDSTGIDTPEDLDRVADLIRGRRSEQ